IDQTDIVMLLTPHIIRTHEITEDDLKPIYIGSQQNLGLNGPPPLIAAPDQPPPPPALGAVGPAQPTPPTTAGPSQPNTPRAPPPEPPATYGPRRGTWPIPGTVAVQPAPAQPTPTPTPVVPPEPTPPTTPPVTSPVTPPTEPPAPPQPAQPPVPTTSPGVGAAQIIISPPSTPFRVGGGPYTIPLPVTDASPLSTVTLTLLFDPTNLLFR